MNSFQNSRLQLRPLQIRHLSAKAIQVRHSESIRLQRLLQRQFPNQRLRFRHLPARHECLLYKAMHLQQILVAELKYLNAQQVDPYFRHESRQLQSLHFLTAQYQYNQSLDAMGLLSLEKRPHRGVIPHKRDPMDLELFLDLQPRHAHVRHTSQSDRR